MAHDTIPARMFEQAKSRPYAPAYYEKTNGTWRATSWKRYGEEIRAAGKALIALDLPVGGKVSMLGFNSATWVIFDAGAMAIGGVGAGIYTTCSAEEVQYITDHAESHAILLESEAQWDKIKEYKHHESGEDKLPLLRHVVMMRGVPAIDDPMVLTWEEFIAKGEDIKESAFDERFEALEPDAVAQLIYTSGTTGPPKGVMLSHENLAWTAGCLAELTRTNPGDCALSYLPLSHIAEQMMSIHGPATTGYAVYYAESIDKVPDNLKEIQPTQVFAVPRIWEKFHAGVTTKLAAATFPKDKLVAWVRGVATAYNEKKNRDQEPGMLLEMQMKLADKLVLSKLKPALGLGRARMCVSGAAPISKEILEFFQSLDIVISEVYGQSEDSGPTSFNWHGNIKLGSVGRPLPGVEVKIADDGEILVKGPNVFLGYYKEQAATAETLIDGWLYSGDLGELDREGFLHITGRKKDIIITAGGKNIAPKNIEASLKNNDLVSEAVVIGDRRKYLTALVTIDEDALARQGANGKAPSEIPALRERVQKIVDETNTHLARVETIKKFVILPRSLTVEHGELTPTLKVKRRKVNEHFADEIESMYT